MTLPDPSAKEQCDVLCVIFALEKAAGALGAIASQGAANLVLPHGNLDGQVTKSQLRDEGHVRLRDDEALIICIQLQRRLLITDRIQCSTELVLEGEDHPFVTPRLEATLSKLLSRSRWNLLVHVLALFSSVEKHILVTLVVNLNHVHGHRRVRMTQTQPES